MQINFITHKKRQATSEKQTSKQSKMTDIDETSCKISINQIIVNAIAGEWCKKIRNFANIINSNIDQLARIQDDNTRYGAIIQLLDFEESDMEKIVKKPVRKTKDASDKADKPAKIVAPPMPFWHVVNKKGEVIASSVVEHKCQALKNPLYNQCTNDKQSGQDYCKQCSKKVNSEGVPKNGNIKMRKEQFKQSYYKFKTPDGKEHQVYYAKYCERKKFAPEDVRKVIDCLNLPEVEYNNLMYKKEAKAKAKKATGEKPPPRKRANNDPKPEDDENEDDENEEQEEQEEQDDEQTNATEGDDDEQTIATEGDDEDVEFAPEDEEIEIDISNYALVKTGTANYAILKSEQTKVSQMTKLKKEHKPYANDEEYNLYAVKDFVSKTEFKIVSLDPIGFMKNLSINLY